MPSYTHQVRIGTIGDTPVGVSQAGAAYLIKLCKYARRSRLLSKQVPLALQAALAVADARRWADKVGGNAGAARCPERVVGAAAWIPGNAVDADAVEAGAARL